MAHQPCAPPVMLWNSGVHSKLPEQGQMLALFTSVQPPELEQHLWHR